MSNSIIRRYHTKRLYRHGGIESGDLIEPSQRCGAERSGHSRHISKRYGFKAFCYLTFCDALALLATQTRRIGTVGIEQGRVQPPKLPARHGSGDADK